MSYKMNLELLVVEKETLDYAKVETVWPVILYLFNNWVRHQFLLIQIQSVMPDIVDSLDDFTPEALSRVTHDLQQKNGVRIDGAALLKDAKIEEAKDELNFSSELEIDERFDQAEEKLIEAHDTVIDKSAPYGLRKRVKQVRAENREQVFESYHSIMEREAAEQEKNQRYVSFDQNVNILKRKSLNQIKRSLAEKFETQKKVLMILDRAKISKSVIGIESLAAPAQIINEPIVDKFMKFLNSQTVAVPQDKSMHIELMKSMKESIYHMLEKKGGLSKLNIAFMNEHRRKQRQLPPLTAIDYNCMDRASIKLKMVLDTLSIVRRISGLAFQPRNLAVVHKQRDYAAKLRETYI